MLMTPPTLFKRTSALAAAFFTLFAASATLRADSPFTAIDIFSDGSGASSLWENRGTGISLQVVDNVLQVRNAGNTSGATIPLPTGFAQTSRHFTLAFDFFLPVGPTRLNEVGFGVATPQTAPFGGWTAVGAQNRFQTANTAPQQLVRAGLWTQDVLAPVTGATQQGIWYNLWVVYDLDAGDTGTVTVWAVTERDEALPAAPAFSAPLVERDAVGNTPRENLRLDGVSFFSVGAGTEGANPGLGANFGDIYIAQGSVVEFTPTQRRNPLVWAALDTFDNASPNADWAGDLDRVALDFSESRLKISGSSGDALPSIRVPLPESMQAGQFTITFDLMIPSDMAWLNIGAISVDDAVSATPANRVGGGDRLVTFPQTAGATQRLTVQSQQTNAAIDLLNPTTLGQWYHVWLVYDVSNNNLDVYRLPFNTDGSPQLTRSQPISARSSYDFFALGIGRGLGSSATGTGFEIDNIYFAPGELLELSPTAGQLGGGGMDPVSELPEQWAAAFENRTENGWFWLSFNQGELESLTGAWAFSTPEVLNWVYINGLGWTYVFGNDEPHLFLYRAATDSWYYTSLEPAEFKFFYSFRVGAWVVYLAPGGDFIALPL